MNARQRKPEYREAELESPASEKAVLGVFLNSESEFCTWQERLEDEDFVAPLNRRIFRAMRVLGRQNRTLAPAIISSAMEKGEDGEKSPVPYMSALKLEAKGIISPATFIDMIKSCSARRQLIQIGQRLNDVALRGDPEASADQIIEAAMAMVAEASASRVQETLQDVGTVAMRVVDQMVQTIQGKRAAGLMTNLDELNELMGPMMPGDLIIVAGATSSGKTALMGQILEEVAAGRAGQEGVPVGMIQAEMTHEAVVRRYVAQRAGISASLIASGNVNTAEDERVLDAAKEFRSLPLFIDAQRGITLSSMVARAKRMARRHGVKLLVIDHAREISPDRRSRDDEFQHMAAVVQASGDLAGDLGIPVILGAQLKRDPAAREIRTASDIRLPGLSDVWGGSAIEQKADTVLFVHRPQYYLERAEPAKSAKYRDDWQADLDRWTGRAQLVLAKRRGGRGYGQREVAYIEHLTRFASLRKDVGAQAEQEAMEF